jgi:putative ABC transport system ATP-binding protein
LRRGRIGFVFQSFNLIEELSVYHNIELPLLYMGVSASERKKRVHKVLDQIKISHRRRNYPRQLSGGQQQRVAIARALISDPKLILSDEPTGNLDSVNGEEIMSLLSQLNNQGTTVVMVTHSPADADKAHRIIQLFDGQIVTENIRKAMKIS